MRENHLFEYAILRIVPLVEREEFINAGVILYCQKFRFLKTRVNLDYERLRALAPAADMVEINDYITSFQKICEGSGDSGPIGKLPIAERFRWLTATRSTILQTSKVHPGLCQDPDDMLEKLFRLHVL